MTSISIIMPCYNRAHDLKRILEAYDEQTTSEPFEIIAIDDCSKDNTFQILSSYKPKKYTLCVERQSKNAGPAAARNRGIPLAQAPLIAFVGDDILPAKDLVQGHLDAHRRFPQPGAAILGKVCWPDDFPRNTLMTHIDGMGAEQFSYYYFKDGQEYDYRHLYTANVSLKTDFLRSIDKWFDTGFIYAAFEDVELAYRLSKKGLKIYYQAAIEAGHYHYHNIWTFSDRQYKSGLMSVVLTRKHPELNKLFRTPLKELFFLVFKPRNLFKKQSLEEAVWVEQLAYRLTSYYEWTPHHLLDSWYLTILRYAYFSGIIQGVFEKTAFRSRARVLYCFNYLAPALFDFINQSRQANIPFPEFIQEGDMQKLRAFLVAK